MIIKLSDGRLLGYELYGISSGAPVFYFHGWPGSRKRASVIDEAAQKANVKLISPDRPGYGLSTYKKDRTLLGWVTDVIELADFLKIKKFGVLGVSGGGPYAAACAYAIPKRLTNVGIAVGLAPPYVRDIWGNTRFRTKVGYLYYHKLPFLASLGALYQMILTHHLRDFIPLNYPAEVDRKVLATLKDELKTNDMESFKQGIRGAALDLVLYSKYWGFKVSDIQSKVFLWYGEADKNVPLAMGNYYARQIKNSKLTIYKNEGHLISVTHAQEMLESVI